MAQRILVLGASGYIGQHLVFALSQQGHQVRAAARRVERLEKQRLANVSCHKVDLHWPENLPALLRDVDTVYYLVHGMGEGGDFIAHERQAALNVRDALRQTPVKQLIFLSSLQAPTHEQSDHLRARQLTADTLRDAYIGHLLGYISVNNLTPLKLVFNAGNGAAGPVIDAIEARLKALGAPVEFIKIHNTPDGTFPNGIPNPLLPECRDDTRNAVIEHGADMGIAFDGDFDRCFLFDEKGQFIEGYYIVGLLAEAFLEKHPGAKIIHDPRLTWNTEAVVTAAGGTPVMSKTGHAFIKERMRTEDAIYGGEMSAHHYFRDFAYCDSGMIPWLLVAELVCLKGQSLGELVRDRMAAFPASGEINSRLAEPAAAIARVEAHFAEEAQAVDRTDGLSMSFPDWRFNLRSSNTEPVVRLNVESRGDIPLMEARTRTLLALLNQ